MNEKMNVFYYTPTRPPFDLSEELSEKVAKEALEEPVNSMRENGFAYIHNALSPELNKQLRDTLLRFVGDAMQRDVKHGGSASNLLDKDPIIEKVVLNPKVLTMAEVMCGKGALLSSIFALVRAEGSPGLGLHSDQNWMPAPFPEHNQLLTVCWACDVFDEEHGATTVIPKSHIHRRHPNHDEVKKEEGLIATECKEGSCVMWNGSVWHGNAPRRAKGLRVTLHVTYTRLSVRPIQNFDHLDDEWLSTRPFEMRVLLGREDSLNKNDVSSELLFRTADWSKQ